MSTLDEDTQKLRRGLYIDNLQLTSNDKEVLLNMYHKAQRVFSSAHLYLKEWMTNCKHLLDVLLAHGVACEEQKQAKVLGLKCNTLKDTMRLADYEFKNDDARVTKKRYSV